MLLRLLGELRKGGHVEHKLISGRNRAGLNDWIYEQANPDAAKKS